MSKHEILLPMQPYTPERGSHMDTHVSVKVSYDKGGMCFGTYKQKPRGYYLSVGRVFITDSSRGFAMFSAPTILLEQTKRRSDKRLDDLFATVANDVAAKAGKVQELIQQVLAKDGCTLAETSVTHS